MPGVSSMRHFVVRVIQLLVGGLCRSRSSHKIELESSVRKTCKVERWRVHGKARMVRQQSPG